MNWKTLKNESWRKILTPGLLFLAFSVYLFFGIQYLAKFETADEHYWIYSNTNKNDYWLNDNGRIKQYWDALKKGDWEKTRINDKPGITLAYVAGIGSWLRTDLEKNIVSGKVPALSKFEKAEKINLFFRLPILIFSGLFVFVLYFLIRRLTGEEWLALFSATLMLLSPILLGVSQIVNPDSLLWLFGFAAILSYLIFLDSGSRLYVAATAVFLGLSLLTKYSSVILFPFFFAVMLFFLADRATSWKIEHAAPRIKRLAISYFIIVGGALLIYAVLMPDNLFNFRHFLKGSIGFKDMLPFFSLIFTANLGIFLDARFFQSRIILWFSEKLKVSAKFLRLLLLSALALIFFTLTVNSLFGSDKLMVFYEQFDSSSKSVFSDGLTLRIILKQFSPLAFSLIPISLLTLIFVWLKNIRHSEKFGWIVFVFSFFVIVFVAAVSQQKLLLTIRYSILLYPVILTLSGIGMFQLLSLERRDLRFRIVAFLAIVLLSVYSLKSIQPFYFNYMNDLLPKKYLVTDAWGYGGYEAAQYLNSIPGSEKQRIWSDYNGVCLFFNGSCAANMLTMKNIQKKSDLTGIPEFSYFVSSRRGQILSRKVWEDLEDHYRMSPVWEMTIAGRENNFIRVFKIENTLQ